MIEILQNLIIGRLFDDYIQKFIHSGSKNFNFGIQCIDSYSNIVLCFQVLKGMYQIFE